MNVLVIGGTRFVGRHIVDALLARGHRVTLFHRGETPMEPRSDVDEIRGDRSSDLHRAADRNWDAIIDTCGYTPREAEIASRLFASRTGRYLFISSISVYDVERAEELNEDAPLQTLPSLADAAHMTPETYGALKALCEAIVRSTFRHRATILRPGLVAGPYDPTDRFTYWPLRVDAGGEVLAPAAPSEPVQYIDARDLAAFAVHVLEQNSSGTYNCVVPSGMLDFGDLLNACSRASKSGARFTWLAPAFLQAQGVTPWQDLPLWVPLGDPNRLMTSAGARRALVAGLAPRPVYETVRDTLAWARQAGKRLGALGAGLSPQRERELLALARATGQPA